MSVCLELVFGLNVKTYEQTEKSITRFDLDKLLPALKKEKTFLKETNAQPLQSMTKPWILHSNDSLEKRMVFLISNQKRIQFKHFQYNTSYCRF